MEAEFGEHLGYEEAYPEALVRLKAAGIEKLLLNMKSN